MRSKKVLESEGANYTMLFFFLIFSAFLTISLPTIPISMFEKNTLIISAAENQAGNINPILSRFFHFSDYLGSRIMLIFQTITAGWMIFLVYNILKKTFKDRELAVNTCFIAILCTPWLFFQMQMTPFLLESFLVVIIFSCLTEFLHNPRPRQKVISVIVFLLLCYQSLWYLPLLVLFLFFKKNPVIMLSQSIKLLFILPFFFLALFVFTGIISAVGQPIIDKDLIALVNSPYITTNHLFFAPFIFLIVAVPWFVRHHYLAKILSKSKKNKKKPSQEKEAPLLIKRFLILLMGSVLLAGTYFYNPFLPVFIGVLLTAPIVGNVRFPAWSLIVPLIFFPFIVYTVMHSEGEFHYLFLFTALLYLLALLAAILLLRLLKQTNSSGIYRNLALGLVFFTFMQSFIYGTFYYYRQGARTKNLLQSDFFYLEDQAARRSIIITDNYGEFLLQALPASVRENLTVTADQLQYEESFPSYAFVMLSPDSDFLLNAGDFSLEKRNIFKFYSLQPAEDREVSDTESSEPVENHP